MRRALHLCLPDPVAKGNRDVPHLPLMPEQLSLFGGAEAPARRIGAAPADERLRAAAAAVPRSIRLGTSSWSFPGWSGIVWDRDTDARTLAREGLRAYAQHPLFRAVGIDRTFYATVPARELARYAEQVPDDFRFLVKAAAECTSPRIVEGRHRRESAHFLDAAWTADEVVAPFAEGLGAKGGTLVFQFPPLGAATTRSPSRFAERLAGFLEALPRGVPYAVELRDRELFGDPYLTALAAGGAVHCLNVHPRMPPIDEQYAATSKEDRIVIRWMLHSGLVFEEAKERYAPFARLVDEDPASRSIIRQILDETGARSADGMLIINNKAEGCAPLSLRRLAEEIAARPPSS